MNKEFSWPVRVYIEDTDAGGIVYYVNYLKFMERARTELLRSFGYDKAGANKESYQFVVYSSEAQYKKPAFLDDNLRVTALIKRASAASILFEQSVWREETLLCQATIKIACVDGKSLKPMPIPLEMASDLKLSLISN